MTGYLEAELLVIERVLPVASASCEISIVNKRGSDGYETTNMDLPKEQVDELLQLIPAYTTQLLYYYTIHNFGKIY